MSCFTVVNQLLVHNLVLWYHGSPCFSTGGKWVILCAADVFGSIDHVVVSQKSTLVRGCLKISTFFDFSLSSHKKIQYSIHLAGSWC